MAPSSEEPIYGRGAFGRRWRGGAAGSHGLSRLCITCTGFHEHQAMRVLALEQYAARNTVADTTSLVIH